VIVRRRASPGQMPRGAAAFTIVDATIYVRWDGRREPTDARGAVGMIERSWPAARLWSARSGSIAIARRRNRPWVTAPGTGLLSRFGRSCVSARSLPTGCSADRVIHRRFVKVVYRALSGRLRDQETELQVMRSRARIAGRRDAGRRIIGGDGRGSASKLHTLARRIRISEGTVLRGSIGGGAVGAGRCFNGPLAFRSPSSRSGGFAIPIFSPYSAGRKTVPRCRTAVAVHRAC